MRAIKEDAVNPVIREAVPAIIRISMANPSGEVDHSRHVVNILNRARRMIK